ncbi:MAG: MBOAT family protein, partial [Candidatus Omnitrophica bacterium]|nr:MBOAT family protein [Candidatus Omnitrophota bacterium]
MVFNSLNFAVFFALVYVFYVFLERKWQNLLLLVASYVFYSFWDWRFLSLVLFSTCLNYYAGSRIFEASGEKHRKYLLTAAVVLNLSVLAYFKYANFFLDNLQNMLWALGWEVDGVTLSVILPLGISFYTFQAMSYPIDIYRKVIEPTRKFQDFALFIVFFPQLVAGPIERARNLLPQIENDRRICADDIYQGSWLIFWGLFKKIVIADNLKKFTYAAFTPTPAVSGSMALLAMYAFAFQVYADFSGYSNMARGIARLLGFNIMTNFRTPFFARNLYDFWQRWHISLTTWVKEYVFYPLALVRYRKWSIPAPIVILLTWSIMGLWHGAAWRFVLWGVYHGILLVLYNKVRPVLISIGERSKAFKKCGNTMSVLLVFNLFSVGILFFALGNVAQVVFTLKEM